MKADEQGSASSWLKKKRIKTLFLFHCSTFHVNDDRCRLFKFSFTWLFCFFQKAKECYGRVLSTWFLFSGGREWVRQPDGWSLWFSRWLFCVVLSDTGQAHWHAASLPSSPPLPSPPPPPPAESLLRRWIPAPWPLAADLERMGWDSPLSRPKKISIFGLLLMTPICHCRITPDRPRDFQLTWGTSRNWSGVGCSMPYRNIYIWKSSPSYSRSAVHHFCRNSEVALNSVLLVFHKTTAHCRIFVSDFITGINYHIGTWLLTQRKLALTPIIIFMGSKNTP